MQAIGKPERLVVLSRHELTRDLGAQIAPVRLDPVAVEPEPDRKADKALRRTRRRTLMPARAGKEAARQEAEIADASAAPRQHTKLVRHGGTQPVRSQRH